MIVNKAIFAALFVLGFHFVASADDQKPRPAKDPELRNELLKRVKADQDGRNAVISLMQENGGKLSDEKQAELKQLNDKLEGVDRDNTRWLAEKVDQHGWPTNSLVGDDGANAAFLLVQHASRDTKFQRKCLDLMVKLSKDEVSPQSVAYLTDRVLLAEGKEQKYGTQFKFENGELIPQPLEDAANVDQRRAEIGLPSMAEYVKQLETVYGFKKKQE